ncbi:hypothetical protein [Haliea sp. E17]|uniref:hypothetical protein n=1 Tax=Haliea sp. E17 TaxID=3401576 RepID=UPI003AAED5CE
MLTKGTPMSAPPCDPDNPTIDIDFRTSAFKDFEWGIVHLSALGGDLTADTCDQPPYPAPPGYDIDADGVGIDSGRPYLAGVEKGETLLVNIANAANDPNVVAAAFDVTGMWVSDFVVSGNGETCEVTLDEYGGGQSTFTFSRKNPANYPNPDPSDTNPNNEFLVPFVGPDDPPLRITGATVTATSGDCGVIGFTNNPVVFQAGDCQQGSTADACSAELAKGVKLDVHARENFVGTIYKQGVFIADDTRGYCGDGDVKPAPVPLYVDLTGNGKPDFVVPEDYCGYPSDDPKIQFLVLKSDLEIDADVIEMIIEDGDDPDYACRSPDPARRPQVLQVPNNIYSDGTPTTPPYDEIPYLNSDGMIDLDPNGVPAPREATVGPCGSTRPSRGGVSIFAYQLRHALPEATYTVGDDTDAELSDFYHKLFNQGLTHIEEYVQTVFPCINRNGTAQSTLQYYLNHIRDNYERDKFDDVAGYILGFLERLDDPGSHLYEDLRGCYFDLAFTAYPISEANTPFTEDDLGDESVPANTIGHLKAELKHLLWLTYTGTGLLYDEVPASDTCLPYFGCPSTP